MENLAQLADTLKRPDSAQQGYTAERHPLVQELIVVWAPCSCYWVGSTGTNSFVTACGQDSCGFKWSEVERALEALKQAENAVKEAPSGLSAVDGSGDVSGAVSETGAGSEEPESQTTGRVIESSEASDMVSEGGPLAIEFESADYDLGGEGG